jgi:hypothetical protein
MDTKQKIIIEIDDDNDEILELLYTRFPSDSFEIPFVEKNNQRRK